MEQQEMTAPEGAQPGAEPGHVMSVQEYQRIVQQAKAADE